MRQLYGSTFVGGGGGGGCGVCINLDDGYASDMDRAIRAKREAEREYHRSVEKLASGIAEISSDVAGAEDRKLAIRAIDKHIKLHGG